MTLVVVGLSLLSRIDATTNLLYVGASMSVLGLGLGQQHRVSVQSVH